mmetsp:Transcript_34244/g.63863  ORF Transcript_34244/g.63863 Transcript_34244/m.63863 type:complete len:108 (+) Transcript_34244:448-771(+)
MRPEVGPVPALRGTKRRCIAEGDSARLPAVDALANGGANDELSGNGLGGAIAAGAAGSGDRERWPDSDSGGIGEPGRKAFAVPSNCAGTATMGEPGEPITPANERGD